MRETRQSGSEGGGGRKGLSLPLCLFDAPSRVPATATTAAADTEKISKLQCRLRRRAAAYALSSTSAKGRWFAGVMFTFFTFRERIAVEAP